MRGLSFSLFGSEGGVTLSDVPPDPEALTPAAGSMSLASRSDHAHPSTRSSHSGLILNASGVLAVTFVRTFAVEPAIVLAPVQPATATTPVNLEVQSYTWTNGVVTGCVVRGYRGQLLPAVIGLLSSLVSYNVFGASAAGAKFTLIAVQAS